MEGEREASGKMSPCLCSHATYDVGTTHAPVGAVTRPGAWAVMSDSGGLWIVPGAACTMYTSWLAGNSLSSVFRHFCRPASRLTEFTPPGRFGAAVVIVALRVSVPR